VQICEDKIVALQRLLLPLRVRSYARILFDHVQEYDQIYGLKVETCVLLRSYLAYEILKFEN